MKYDEAVKKLLRRGWTLAGNYWINPAHNEGMPHTMAKALEAEGLEEVTE